MSDNYWTPDKICSVTKRRIYPSLDAAEGGALAAGLSLGQYTVFHCRLNHAHYVRKGPKQ